MTPTNDEKVAKAAEYAARRADPGLEAKALLREVSAEFCDRVATTEAQKRFARRLTASDLRQEDRLACAELQESDQLTALERRVLEAALRYVHWGQDRAERVDDPAWLRRVAVETAGLESARLAAVADQDKVILAGDRLRCAKSPAEVERRLAELRDAEETYRQSRSVQEYAQGRLLRLYQERDARRREAELHESTRR